MRNSGIIKNLAHTGCSMKCISHEAYMKIIAVTYEDKNNMRKERKQTLLHSTISVFIKAKDKH